MNSKPSSASGNYEHMLPQVTSMLRDLDEVSIRLITQKKGESLFYGVNPRREESSVLKNRVVDFTYLAEVDGGDSDLRINLHSRFNSKPDSYAYVELEPARFDDLLKALLDVAAGHLRKDDPANLERMMRALPLTPT